MARIPESLLPNPARTARVQAYDVTGPAPENRDALKIEGSATKTVRNIVIDHCSLSWAIDETLSVWGPHDNITFSNNVFSEALNQSLHPNGSHGFGVILGPHPGSSITMVGNLFAHVVEWRSPSFQSGRGLLTLLCLVGIVVVVAR